MLTANCIYSNNIYTYKNNRQKPHYYSYRIIMDELKFQHPCEERAGSFTDCTRCCCARAAGWTHVHTIMYGFDPLCKVECVHNSQI